MKWTRNSAHFLARFAVAAILLTSITVFRAHAATAMSDAEVKRAVETQLSIDGAIPAGKIDVVVSQGVAELTGTVDNLLAKERSTYVAENVRGVKAVSNRIEVSPAESRDDSAIETDISWALARDPAADSYRIVPKVRNHVVTLTGTVNSFAEKQLAARVAKGVSGVTELRNELDIEYSGDRSDAQIAADIRQRLKWDVLVNDGLLDVSVDSGNVQLTGTVGSLAEKRRAQWDAWVMGAKKVDISEVEVDPMVQNEDLKATKYQMKTDEEIRDAVKAAALFDPRVYSFNINPVVDSGWVTLSGSVENLAAKRAATQLARNVVGVRGVTNMLDVRPEQPRSDAAIAADVRQALRSNRYTDGFQVDLSVSDGVVTLTGNVETPFERSEAARAASQTKGVRRVENNIDATGNFGDFGTSYYFSTWYPPAVTVSVQNKTDANLKEDVSDEIFWSPYVDSDSVEVKVEQGIVTLSGNVDNWHAYRSAEENAFEAGATSVVNNIQVNPDS